MSQLFPHCHNCMTVFEPTDMFCPRCGRKRGMRAIPHLTKSKGVFIEKAALDTSIRSGRKTIIIFTVIFALFTLLYLVLYATASSSSPLSELTNDPAVAKSIMLLTFFTMLAYTLVFLGLVKWAATNPFLAGYSGLILIVTLSVAFLSAGSFPGVIGVVFIVFSILALGKATLSGYKFRKLKAAGLLDVPVVTPKPVPVVMEVQEEAPVTANCVCCDGAMLDSDSFCRSCGTSVCGTTALEVPLPLSESPSGKLSRKMNALAPDINDIKVILIMFAVFTGFIGFTGFMVGTLGASVMAALLAHDIAMGVTAVMWLLKGGREFFKPFTVAPPLKSLGLIAAVTVPMVFVNGLAVNAINSIAGLDIDFINAVYLEMGNSMFIVVLVIVFQPAIFEEIVSRVMVFGLARRHLGREEAIFISAAGFAAFHNPGLGFPIFLMLGVYLGWLREWTKSIYPSMIAHAMYNATVIVMETYNVFG